MPNDWSPEEVEAAVADYFDMLANELRDKPYNKAEHNRRLRQLLTRRTRSSVEQKHRNISAVLIEFGYPYVDGYKPLSNYQTLLREIVQARLSVSRGLQRAAAAAVEKKINKAPKISDLLSIQVKPPTVPKRKPLLHDSRKTWRSPVRRNYLEIESRNRSLGEAGEKLVIEFEQERLWRAGKKKLASRVEQVSETQGDYLGFDVLSFELNGRERFIEVKTTSFGELTPFFVSRNEVAVSEFRGQQYQLYRLFQFLRQPKLFVLAGSLSNTCRLDPIQFSALPKSY